jgi:hypothetical protein
MRTPEDNAAAVETLEHVLAALRADEDRDEATERLIQAMEDERAALLADRLRT